jgi:hypothetical protein
MRPLLAVSCLLILLLAPPLLSAQDSTPSSSAKVLAPVIDNQTLVIAHVDLANLDLTASLDRMADLIQLPQRARQAIAHHQKQWIDAAQQLAHAGARDLYVLLSMHQLPAVEPLWVVPVSKNADAAAIEKLLTVAPHYGEVGVASRRVGELLAFARPTVLKNMENSKPEARPEVAAAFAALQGSAAQVLVLPSADTRRAIEEILPVLPKELGSVSSQVFTNGIVWAAAGIDLPPSKLGVRIVIQSASPAAAATLNSELAQLLQKLAELSAVREAVPNFATFAQQLKPVVNGDRLLLENQDVTALTAIVAPPFEAARAQAARGISMNNLKQIMLALHNYHADHKKFVSRVTKSPEGKSLLSWRVAILPDLDANSLYKEFHHDEPWDSEHNRKLIDRMPSVFRSPLSAAGPGRTTYLAPVLKGGIFGEHETLDFKQITDGTSQTIMIVEADAEHAAIWTKPDDIEIDAANPFRGLLNPSLHGFLTGFADGSARLISDKTEKKVVAALFTATGQEPIGTLP